MSIIKKLPWAEIVVSAIAIAIGVGVYAYAHRDEDSLEEAKRRGAAIVQALGAYQREQGTYPEQLDGLVPRYIAAIEQPDWGLREWRYRRYAAEDVAGTGAQLYFHLSVAADESGYPVLYYDLALSDWVLNH